MHTIFRNITRSRPSLLACRTSSISCIVHTNPNVRTLITKHYTKEHETIIFDDETGIGTVTLTDHAQSNLGDVVFVELPAGDRKVTKGESVGAVESVKAASDIYSPVSGTVTEINAALGDQPNLLNKSPEKDGWLYKIKLSDSAEIKELLTEEAYKKLLE